MQSKGAAARSNFSFKFASNTFGKFIEYDVLGMSWIGA